MTDDVVAVAELARDFFDRHVTPTADQSVRDGRPARDLYRAAGEMGLQFLFPTCLCGQVAVP